MTNPNPASKDSNPGDSLHGMVRAFVVSAAYVDASVIVFAENVTEAKKLSKHCEWFEDCEWTDLRVKREMELDALAAERGRITLDGRGEVEARIMRGLGWHELEGCAEECEKCGLYQWESIHESYLTDTEDGYICRKCSDIGANAESIHPESKP